MSHPEKFRHRPRMMRLEKPLKGSSARWKRKKGSLYERGDA